MTKEEVLQKVNDYCNEKSYTNETLTDVFKDKFAEHFVKANPDANVDDEQILAGMKFALNTAFSSASAIITEKTNAFTSKENEYKKQIEELSKKAAKNDKNELTIPKEVQDKLDEFEKFKDLEIKTNKRKEIIKAAKASIRPDLHKSFETFVEDYNVSLDENESEQVQKLVARFQAIFKDSIGDIKPLAPRQVQKRDDELLATMPKIKIQ